MKTIILTLGILAFKLMLAFPLSAHNPTNEGIDFDTTTWTAVAELAKTTGKPIFLAITASWCGPCNRLKRNTFTDEDVAVFYNDNFINVVLDGEKGEGIELARKYAVRGYPTLLFVGADGEVVHRSSGYHSPADFLKLGKQAKAVVE